MKIIIFISLIGGALAKGCSRGASHSVDELPTVYRNMDIPPRVITTSSSRAARQYFKDSINGSTDDNFDRSLKAAQKSILLEQQEEKFMKVLLRQQAEFFTEMKKYESLDLELRKAIHTEYYNSRLEEVRKILNQEGHAEISEKIILKLKKSFNKRLSQLKEAPRPKPVENGISDSL